MILKYSQQSILSVFCLFLVYMLKIRKVIVFQFLSELFKVMRKLFQCKASKLTIIRSDVWHIFVEKLLVLSHVPPTAHCFIISQGGVKRFCRKWPLKKCHYLLTRPAKYLSTTPLSTNKFTLNWSDLRFYDWLKDL